MFWEKIVQIWNQEIFSIGSNSIALSSLVILIVSLVALFMVSSFLKKFLVKRVFLRYNLDRGTSESIAAIIRYVIIVVGLMVILQTSGIDIGALGILFGALGIGIGFGLQSIMNNFISGIILLFERPIKIGDRIDVDGVAGNISTISARSTTIITNDNIAIIVPNSEFINSKVINWSLNDNRVRFNFPVGVAYKEDPQVIKKLLLEVANACPGVMQNPKPDVLFDDFGDSSLNFVLRVWSQDYCDRPKVLKSILYYAVFEKFKEHKIEIPFPQRDVHIKSNILPKEKEEEN